MYLLFPYISTSTLAKDSLSLYIVALSPLSGFSTNPAIFVRAPFSHYLISNPVNRIHTGILSTSSFFMSISDFQGLTINGFLSNIRTPSSTTLVLDQTLRNLTINTPLFTYDILSMPNDPHILLKYPFITI